MNHLLSQMPTPKVAKLQRKIGKTDGKTHELLDSLPTGTTDACEDARGPAAVAGLVRRLRHPLCAVSDS